MGQSKLPDQRPLSAENLKQYCEMIERQVCNELLQSFRDIDRNVVPQLRDTVAAIDQVVSGPHSYLVSPDTVKAVESVKQLAYKLGILASCYQDLLASKPQQSS